MPSSYLQGYNYTDLSRFQTQAENFRFPIQQITSKDQRVRAHTHNKESYRGLFLSR